MYGGQQNFSGTDYPHVDKQATVRLSYWTGEVALTLNYLN